MECTSLAVIFTGHFKEGKMWPNLSGHVHTDGKTVVEMREHQLVNQQKHVQGFQILLGHIIEGMQDHKSHLSRRHTVLKNS